MLNNELTDFSFRTHEDGVPIANRLEPGKRPRSSMAPTIVMKDDKPFIVTGSPGGSRIIGYVVQSIIAMIDWQQHPQAAVTMPICQPVWHIRSGNRHLGQYLSPELQIIGFQTNIRDLNSGLHAIMITRSGAYWRGRPAA